MKITVKPHLYKNINELKQLPKSSINCSANKRRRKRQEPVLGQLLIDFECS